MGSKFCPNTKFTSLISLLPEAVSSTDSNTKTSDNSVPTNDEFILGKLVEEVMKEVIDHYNSISQYILDNQSSIIFSIIKA